MAKVVENATTYSAGVMSETGLGDIITSVFPGGLVSVKFDVNDDDTGHIRCSCSPGRTYVLHGPVRRHAHVLADLVADADGTELELFVAMVFEQLMVTNGGGLSGENVPSDMMTAAVMLAMLYLVPAERRSLCVTIPVTAYDHDFNHAANHTGWELAAYARPFTYTPSHRTKTMEMMFRRICQLWHPHHINSRADAQYYLGYTPLVVAAVGDVP